MIDQSALSKFVLRLFTFDVAEYYTRIKLQINNTTLDMYTQVTESQP